MALGNILCWCFLPILAVLAAFYAQYYFNYWNFMDFGKHIYNHYPGPCRVVEGIEYGAEKIIVLPSGLAVLTSGIQLPGRNMTWVERPGVYMFDFNKPWQNVTRFAFTSNYDAKGFNPHGVAFFENPRTGKLSIFLVNHHPEGDRIEIFDVDFVNSRLHFRKYVKHPILYNVNDIAPTGEASFYATIDQYSTSGRGKMLEMFGFLSWGRLVHFDGKNAKIVAEDLNYPNGITITSDKRFILVAEFLGQHVVVFETRKDGSLYLQRRINTHSHIDNIELDHDTGDMWIGSHPILHRIFSLKKGPKAPPSQVLRIRYDPWVDSEAEIHEVFMDDGQLVMGSSAAAHWKGKLLVGSVFERLVYCDIITPYQGSSINDRWNH